MPVEANDYPGFIANRILMPMINEAFYALMEGVGTREAIDTVMKLGMNHPMGPLTLADFIGLDVCLAILEVLHQGLGDPKYRPCPLLRRMVDAGHLGRKSGQGVYTYETYVNHRGTETRRTHGDFIGCLEAPYVGRVLRVSGADVRDPVTDRRDRAQDQHFPPRRFQIPPHELVGQPVTS